MISPLVRWQARTARRPTGAEPGAWAETLGRLVATHRARAVAPDPNRPWLRPGTGDGRASAAETRSLGSTAGDA